MPLTQPVSQQNVQNAFLSFLNVRTGLVLTLCVYCQPDGTVVRGQHQFVERFAQLIRFPSFVAVNTLQLCLFGCVFAALCSETNFQHATPLCRMSHSPELKDDPMECPLCMEPLEIDDVNFFPCTCGYQICRFCWHRIRTDENGLCPACRKVKEEVLDNSENAIIAHKQKCLSKQ